MKVTGNLCLDIWRELNLDPVLSFHDIGGEAVVKGRNEIICSEDEQ